MPGWGGWREGDTLLSPTHTHVHCARDIFTHRGLQGMRSVSCRGIGKGQKLEESQAGADLAVELEGQSSGAGAVRNQQAS